MSSTFFVLLLTTLRAEADAISAEFEECNYDSCDNTNDMYLIQKKVEVGLNDDQLLTADGAVQGKSDFLPGLDGVFVSDGDDDDDKKAPICTGTEEKSGTNGMGYRGCQTITQGGYTCQKWTDQTPNKHDRIPENYPKAGLGDHNFCRNPDNMPGGIWCYTVDQKEFRWDYCDPMDVVKQLPECWKKAHDSKINKDYYFNPCTDETSWTRPSDVAKHADASFYESDWKWPWQHWQWNSKKYSFGSNAVHSWDVYLFSSLCTWLIWAVLICLVWCLRYPAEPNESVIGDPVETFEKQHFSCMKNKPTCVCSFLCPAIQFADNQHLGGFLKGHFALFAFLVCGLLNDVTMCGLFVCGFFTSTLIVIFRQNLRERLGLEPWSLNTCLIDIPYVCCCPCCALAQEALVVQYAYNRMKDDTYASSSPRVVMTEPIMKMPRSRSPTPERVAGTTVILERETYRARSPSSQRSLSSERVVFSSTYGAAFR